MINNTELERQFTAALRTTYDQAVQQGYFPTRFMQMLELYGGVGTAKRLLATHEIQEGLMRLWELKQLVSSMEAFVLQERFAPLFTAEERAEAHWRLEELGFFANETHT